MNIQTITPILYGPDSITLNLTESQYEEIKFAVQSLNKRRQTSRNNMAPKRLKPDEAPRAVKPIINFAYPVPPKTPSPPRQENLLTLPVKVPSPPIPQISLPNVAMPNYFPQIPASQPAIQEITDMQNRLVRIRDVTGTSFVSKDFLPRRQQ